MKMTEKMKAVLQEEMEKAGMELSEEELDAVSGGRLMTEREKEDWEIRQKNLGIFPNWSHMNLIDYRTYIKSLPDDAPEELYDPCKNYEKILYGKNL